MFREDQIVTSPGPNFIRHLGFVVAVCASLVSGKAIADENVIPDASIRIVGFHAQVLTDLIKQHKLAPDTVKVFEPNEAGEVVTQFVMLTGWDSIDKIPGAKDVCADLCLPEQGKPLHLTSSTVLKDDTIRKTVFIDLNAIAPGGDLTSSLGFSVCVAEQLIREAQAIKPVAAKCLPRLAGGTFTDRRRVKTIK